jgi:hypothetical protein
MLLLASCLFGLLYDTKDGSQMFLWNVGLSLNYMALNPEDHSLHKHHPEKHKHNICYSQRNIHDSYID